MQPAPQKHLDDWPTTAKIQECARQLILALKADQGLSNLQIAALIDAKDGDVIARLEEKSTIKVPASLFTAAGKKYGESYIQPYMNLMGFKAVPRHCDEAVNALPALTALSAKMATAMASGRVEIDHISLAGMLHDLREVDAVISKLRARASELGMAA